MNKSILKSIITGILITLSCLTFSQGGLSGGGGGTSGWVVNYSCSGSCIYHGWQVSNLPGGGQTATPITIDQMAIFPQPFSTPNFGASGAGTSYTPPGAPLPVLLSASLDLSLNIQTTYTWSGSTPSPNEVKVALTGNSYSQAIYGSGTASADDGLGHPQVGGTSVINPYGSMTSFDSTGTRYRKFKVSNGSVTFQTTLKGTASGLGYISVLATLNSYESPWAVAISSDRGETFRRVVAATGPKPVSNFLEDDEVTARGGDGVFYGDSVISAPSQWNGNDWDFATTMEASIFGPWSTFNTSGNFSVSKAPPGNASSSSWLTLLGFSAGDTLVMGDDNMSLAKKDFTATLNATDSVNSISDSCIYKMSAHLPAESPHSKGVAASTKLYKVRDTFPDYTGSHDPKSLLRIDAPTTKKLTVSVSSSVTSTSGWEQSGEGSLGFSIKMVDLHFGAAFKHSGSLTMSYQYSIAGDWVIPGGTYFEFWDLPKGTVTKYMFERYGDNGYIRDGAEFGLSMYSEAFTWNSGPISSASVNP